MRESKGQASVEFLMTYGWVIIVLGLAFVVLWQWGIFNPAGSTKQTYMGFWGVVPVDFNYKSNGSLVLSLQNNIIDGDVNITGINATGPNGEQYTDPNLPTTPKPLPAGTIYYWNQNITAPGTSGNAYSIIISITYVDNRTGPNITFRSSGTLEGTTEKA